ncbi:helix-turn-helix transcriptional regulator [bacterium]|nr:helix-turn-helix transcriptional regulator [bacterium]
MLKYITRQEELLLLAILHLNDNAYGMSIKAHIEEVTDEKWSFGAIYAPLSRLLKKALVTSIQGAPTPERGGKSKIFYTLTDRGRTELANAKRVHEASWGTLTIAGLE